MLEKGKSNQTSPTKHLRSEEKISRSNLLSRKDSQAIFTRIVFGSGILLYLMLIVFGIFAELKSNRSIYTYMEVCNDLKCVCAFFWPSAFKIHKCIARARQQVAARQLKSGPLHNRGTIAIVAESLFFAKDERLQQHHTRPLGLNQIHVLYWTVCTGQYGLSV